MDSFNSQIVANTIGAYEIGVLISYALFGMTTTQTYIYHSRFADDSRKLRGLVVLLWVCELGHALCIGYTLYFYTISSYNHPDVLVQTSPWTLHVGFSISASIVACGAYNHTNAPISPSLEHFPHTHPLVQAFFGFRIYMLSKRLYIPVLIWIMVFLRLSLFILSLVVTNITVEDSFITSAWIVGVANDLLITITLVFLLRCQRKEVHKRYDL
ncbi:hypothetical protein B0H14DRAFT_507170 [Mycena olivaceomarginata]|nr:hypothetical protein B0H14DRAFT_507170 [Mycena olivaceomarginata]